MIFMNLVMSHAKMYSGEHSDDSVYSCPIQSKACTRIDQRDMVHIVEYCPIHLPQAGASYFSTRSNFKTSLLALG